MNWKYFGKVHQWIYRASGGRLGAKMGPIDVALVETIGRKSGQPRVAPLACYPYRDSIVVSASNSGMERHPAWYLNLQANPKCKVQLGRDHYEAVAEDLSPEERDAFLPTVFEINDHQREYREMTDRDIPLVWLRRSQEL